MDINDDPEVRAARKCWLAGGSAVAVVALLASRGAKIEAATYARLALAKPDCPDSLAYENEWCSTYPHMAFIRERASPEQAEIFDRAGIPPLE